MGIYHDLLGRESRNVVKRPGAEIDASFFVLGGLEELDSYEEIVAYWFDTLDRKLIGLEDGELT
jgi:hypothetical protein